jgi:conjugal transfer pilus assembly protein TraB
MANSNSPLAKKVRQKQMLILGIVGIAVMAAAVISAFYMSGKKREVVAPAITSTRSLIGATTDDVDREKWRERSAGDMELLRQQVRIQQEAMSGLQKQLSDFTELQKKQGESPNSQNKSELMDGVVPPPNAPPPRVAVKDDRKLGERMFPTDDMSPQSRQSDKFPVSGPGMVMPDGTVTGPAQQILTPSVAIGTVKFEKKTPVKANGEETAKGVAKNGVRSGLDGERIPNPATPNGSVTGLSPVEKTYVPAGAFGRVVILGGIDAPASGQAQSNPHPVLLRFLGNINLPGGAKVDLKDCLVTADGVGDISSERAQVRTQRISCRIGKNKIADTEIRGHVNGEDGKAGVRGKLVTKSGAILANALFTGTMSALGSAIQASAQTTNTTAFGTTVTQTQPGQELKAGMGAGVNKAFDRLSNYYIALAEKTFPVIEIDSMRVVDLIVTQGFFIEAK